MLFLALWHSSSPKILYNLPVSLLAFFLYRPESREARNLCVFGLLIVPDIYYIFSEFVLNKWVNFNRAYLSVVFKNMDHGVRLPGSKFLLYHLLGLGHLPPLSKPLFPHLQNGHANRIQLIERMHTGCLTQHVAYIKHSINIKCY